MAMLDGSGWTSVRHALEAVAERARAQRGGWVLGHGLRVAAWDQGRYPTADELERVSAGVPVALWSFDHHALVASSSALRAARIDASTSDPQGGVIDRDARGQPTGVVLERAAHVLWDIVPEPDGIERDSHLSAADRRLGQLGFVEVHDLHAPAWLGPALASLHADAKRHGTADTLRPLRAVLYPPVAELARIHAQAGAWQSDAVRLGGGKLFADGTINSRTAHMLEPYKDPIPGHEHGTPLWTVEGMAEAMLACWSLGLGLAVHAIGDAAVRAVLDACERALAQDPPRTGARNIRRDLPALRIEHAEIVDEADVRRFSPLAERLAPLGGLAISVQPCHLLTDIEALRRSLPHRLDRVLPLREMLEQGCEPGLARDDRGRQQPRLVFGSDAPIVRPEPTDSVHGAVHRRRPGMAASESIAASQAITETQAWAAFAPA